MTKPWIAIIVAMVAAGAAPHRAEAGNHGKAGLGCLRVTATDRGDAAELRRAVAAELSKVGRACLDVALVDVELVDDGGEVELTARVKVVVSDGHQIAAVMSSRATLRVTQREAREQRSSLQHDVLDEVAATMMQTLGDRLRPQRLPSS
jgi:hypothetical protein